MAVGGPLGEVLGRDPLQFVTNMVKAEHSVIKALTVRMSQRTGITEWTTKPKNGKSFSSKMVSGRGDSVQQTALIVTLWALRAPTDLVDEARRTAFNLPVGKRSADAEPTQLPASWGSAAEMGQDPITITAILTIAIPILVQIAAVVLPTLIDLVGGAVGGLTGKPKEEAPSQPVVEEDKGFFGIPVEVLAVAGAAVGAFLILRS